jgi:hypothetical protein
MAKIRSARGDIIDFELIAIKKQLAANPIPVGVDDRRRFIDEKDGIRTRQVIQEPVDALGLAQEAAEISAAAAIKESPAKKTK